MAGSYHGEPNRSEFRTYVLAESTHYLQFLAALSLFFLLDFPHPAVDELSRCLRRLLGCRCGLLPSHGVNVGTQAFSSSFTGCFIFG